MRVEKIYDFFKTAEKADIVLTIGIIVIILAVIIELLSIGIKVRKIYKMQKTEFNIIAKEFARIAPNHYVTNYSTDTENENKADSKMDTV